ncbi:type II toxin-antitoxin system RelE/ParE family toxin [Patescibacteria group bacterium]|nr:type II toxin-antitoxin system RelE/ParE family toxin [Patescibacteria group bacterium]
MELKYKIIYHPEVIKDDIPKIQKQYKSRIEKAIKQKLATAPRSFGKQLHYSLRNHRKLRVGNYRIIFLIKKHVVNIICIGLRDKVYKNKRLYN